MSLSKSISHFFYYFEWIPPKIFGVISGLESNVEKGKKEEGKKPANSMREKIQNSKKAERERRVKELKLINRLLMLDLSFRDVRHLGLVTKDVEVFSQVANYLVEAQQLKIGQYINIDLIFAVITGGRNIGIVFQIAKMFKNTKLDEDEGFADFEKLIFYINIPDDKLLEMTYVMVESKNIGYQLKQKDLIKFYDSNKPFSEDIYNFGQALMFAKKYNLDLNINEFVNAMINQREPFRFVNNFYNIEKHGLTIPKKLFCSVNLSQETMTEFINLYINAREHNLDLDFEQIVKDYKLNKDLKELIVYLIRFKSEGIDEITYKKLFYFVELNGNIKNLMNAYFYARSKDMKFENLYQELTKFLAALDLERDMTKINSLSFVKAIYLGESNFELKRNKIIKDYHSGVDVLSILYSMHYAKTNGIEVNYLTAKLVNKGFEGGLQSAIHKVLNPYTIKGTEIKVTTKDNIEIVVELNIVVLLNIKNVIRGSDEDVIIDRANNIFIEEIQNRFNHNEIIKNINVISQIIILRLKGEMKGNVRESIAFYKEEHGHNKKTTKKHKVVEPIKEPSHFHTNYEKENENQKRFNAVSKYIPTKIIIPKINFVKDTFKEIEIAKEEFEIHKHKAEAEIERLKADIKIKEAWAKDGNLKYYFLKEEEENPDTHNHLERQ